MKVKDLIEQLKKQNLEAPVYVYNRSSGNPLWIPTYDLDSQVSIDKDYAKDYDIDENAVFITAK